MRWIRSVLITTRNLSTICLYYPLYRCDILRVTARVLENRLVLIHKTEVPDVPLAMQEFQGRLLVGVGKSLRVSATE